MRKTLRFAVRIILLVVLVDLVLLGLCCVYDMAIGDAHVPSLQIGFGDRKAVISNSTHFKYGQWQDWESLQPTLKIVGAICPEGADWVRGRYENGLLVFGRQSSQNCAAYNFLTGTLTLYPSFFVDNDGIKATVLLHEFRHSKQNYAKVCLSMHAYLFSSQGVRFIERDAELYEAQACLVLNLPDGALVLLSGI